MRKILAITAILAALGASASADILEIRPYAGFTTVNMGEVNNDMQQTQGIFHLIAGGYPVLENQPLNNGVVLGMDVSSGQVLPWKFLKLDWRNEFLQTNQSSYKITVPGPGNAFFQDTEQGTLSSSLLGLVWQPSGEDSRLDLSLGGFFGVGYGTFSRFVNIAENNFGSGLYTRIGGVAQIEMRVNWHLSPAWTLGASSAYRLASLGQMYDGEGHSFQSTLGAIGLTNPDALDVDFGGITATGALSYAF